jgi:thioester reductase-like protein
MGKADGILLTGATGFLGRYLLHGLSASGRLVAVVARDSPSATAEERVRALIGSWKQTHLPQLVVLTGDLLTPNLGLSPSDRGWLARNCTQVVHGAASVAFRSTANGDPWATNADGTGRLLEWCASVGIREFHHISTAFVCGDRAGPILEDELDCRQGFHNAYERSKFEAERLVRNAGNLRATIYRPSVIVGDSRTGATSSFQGFYRFPEAADRLAKTDAMGRRWLRLRLPLDGNEPRNLVPVDWVARAVAHVVGTPALHGYTYHLTAAKPVTVTTVKAAVEDALKIKGVSFAGHGAVSDPSALEELFLSSLRDYEPYLYGDPEFDCRNTRTAMPSLPAPVMDRACLARLVRFAKSADWGRRLRTNRFQHSPLSPCSPVEREQGACHHSEGPPLPSPLGNRGRGAPEPFRCTHYIETFFPQAARRSTLASLSIDVGVRLEIVEEGSWHLRWMDGELTIVRRNSHEPADVTYRLDSATFENVISGRISAHEAFMARDIEILGDIEKGLKLAVLFGRFNLECPYPTEMQPEAKHALDLVR